MSKYILIGDTHLGIKDSSKIYHQTTKRLFERVCEYGIKHGITKLIHLGDFFDNRKKLSIKSIHVALEIAKMVDKSFDVSWFIIGNHDTVYKTTMTPTSLSIIEPFENINIVDEPMNVDGDVLLLPWLFDEDDLDDSAICIGHFDINDIVMNSSGTTSRGHKMNVSDFSKYELVLSGHYHTPGKYQNISYIGTPFQMTFNDIDSKRGFYVLDTDICEIEFIEFTNYPHHVIIKDTDDVSKMDIKGNNVRLVFNKDYGMDQNIMIIESVRSQAPNTLKIKYVSVDSTFTEEMISEEVVIKGGIDVLYNYYDKAVLTDAISLPVLKKVAKQIYDEVVNG